MPREVLAHDPTLPALPASARQALDRVVEEKGWDRFRLELLDSLQQR